MAWCLACHECYRARGAQAVGALEADSRAEPEFAVHDLALHDGPQGRARAPTGVLSEITHHLTPSDRPSRGSQ